jgi:hypothetical protein
MSKIILTVLAFLIVLFDFSCASGKDTLAATIVCNFPEQIIRVARKLPDIKAVQAEMEILNRETGTQACGGATDVPFTSRIATLRINGIEYVLLRVFIGVWINSEVYVIHEQYAIRLNNIHI